MEDGQALRYQASLCTLTIRLFLRHVTYSLASLRSTAIASTNIYIQGIDGGSGTTYPERLLPSVWRLSICLSTFSDITNRKSTLLGHGGVPAASMRDPAYTELADVETGFNSRTDGALVNIPSGQSY
jgi:hypothetical protein